MAHALAELGFCGVLTAAKERLKGNKKKIMNKFRYIIFFMCLSVHRFKVQRSGLPCSGWLWESKLPGRLPCLNILTRTSRLQRSVNPVLSGNEYWRLIWPQKAQKSNLRALNLMCYNEQKLNFRLFTNPSRLQIEYLRSKIVLFLCVFPTELTIQQFKTTAPGTIIPWTFHMKLHQFLFRLNWRPSQGGYTFQASGGACMKLHQNDTVF